MRTVGPSADGLPFVRLAPFPHLVPVMQPFKYWLVTGDRDRIVVEWFAPAPRGALLPVPTPVRSEGILCERHYGYTVAWLYDKPPEDIDERVCTILAFEHEYETPGADFQGCLAKAEVDGFVEAALPEAA